MTGYTYTLTPGKNEFLVVQRAGRVLVLDLSLTAHPPASVVRTGEALLDSVRFAQQ